MTSVAERPFVELVASLRWNEIGATVASIRPIQERKDSAIADVTIVDAEGRSREVIVKRHRAASRDGRSAAELARHEFSMLRTLGTSLSQSSKDLAAAVVYTTPRPLLLDEDLCVVAMERAAGQPLDRIISAARRRVAHRRLVEPLRRAATWLRLMQQQTARGGQGRERLDAIVDSAVSTLDLAAGARRDLGAPRDSIERRLHELAARVSPTSLHVTGHHGDFWPGNVFIDADRVEVIDFEGFRDGLPLQDVVYLLWYLDQLPLAAVDGARLRRMFLDAYLSGAPLDDNLFSLLRLIRAVEAIAWGEADRRSAIRRILQRSPQRVVAAVVSGR